MALTTIQPERGRSLIAHGLAIALTMAVGQAQDGLPAIRTFSRLDYQESSQILDCAVGPGGTAFFAPLGKSLLMREGDRWHAVPTATPEVRAVAVDGRNRTYVGGLAAIGLLAVDATGFFAFVSLGEQVQPPLGDDENVRSIATDGDRALVVTRHRLVECDGDRVVSQVYARNHAFTVAAREGLGWLVAARGHGLLRYDDGRLEPAAAPSLPPEAAVVDMLPAGAGAHLLLTRDHGLLRRTTTGLQRMPPDGADALASTIAYDCARLGDGRLVVGTDKGCRVLDAEGRLLSSLGRSEGLADETCYCVAAATDDCVWVGTNRGIACIDLSRACEVFDHRLGLLGTVMAMCWHDGRLQLATTRGIYRIEAATPGAAWRCRRISQADEMSAGVFSTGDRLYATSVRGLHRIDDLVEHHLMKGMLLGVTGSSRWRDWLFVGRHDGATAVQLDGDGVAAERPLPGVTGAVDEMFCLDDLLLVTENSTTPVILEMKAGPQGEVRPIRLDQPSGFAHWIRVGERILCAAGNRLFAVEPDRLRRGQWPPGNDVSPRTAPDTTAYFTGGARTPAGTEVLASSLGLLLGDQSTAVAAAVYSRPELANGYMPVISGAAGDVVFVGAEDILYRIDASSAAPLCRAPAPPRFSKITITANDTGAPSWHIARPLAPTPCELAAGDNGLAVEFAAMFASADLPALFSWRLSTTATSGEWTEWQPVATATFDRLPTGDYTLQARVRRGMAGQHSAPAAFAFVVLPHWYATRTALVAGIFGLLAIVLGATAWNGRRLRQRARRLELLVQERTDELQSTFERVPVGLLVLDCSRLGRDDAAAAELRALRANAAAIALLPGQPDDPRPDLAPLRAPLAQLLAALPPDAREAAREITWTAPNGTPRHVFVRVALALGAAGDRSCVFVSLVDETARRQAEATGRELEQRMQRAQRLESLGVLAGGVAHDFNNLLTAILGNTELVRDDLPILGPGSEAIDHIESAARSAAELCHQMLVYAGRGQFAIGAIDLSQLVGEMIEILRSSISKRARLELDLQRHLPHIAGDPSRIRQVVMNLVTNAAEALVDGVGTITVKTGTEGGVATALEAGEAAPTLVFLRVRDSGCGMDQATRERVFEPFFSTKFTGRGLGMAAVLGVVRAHKGSIDIDSAPGQGTTVTVRLPADAADSADVDPTHDVHVTRLDGARVLVVDDDPAVAAVATTVLRRAGCDIVAVAHTGKDGIASFLAAPHGVDVVLLDLTMPDLGGEEVLAAMRRIRADVRVLLSSGYGPDAVATLLEGANLAFLRKPYNGVELVQMLATLLPASRRA